MVKGGIIVDNTAPRVVKSLVHDMTIDEKEEFELLEVLDIDLEQAEYLQTIGEGWAYPLERFMNEIELLEVMHMKTLTEQPSGTKHLLSVPITQSVTKQQKQKLEGKSKIGLKCSKISNQLLAVIEEPVFFENRKEEISARFFGTQSVKHPKVERIMAQGDFLISGKSMRFLQHIKFNDGMDGYRLTPAQIQEEIKAKNADVVYAFQVRNPLHNGHVLMLKDTRD
jgi:3'-phosphoadenosine 5'-phosphosulfate synthase